MHMFDTLALVFLMLGSAYLFLFATAMIRLRWPPRTKTTTRLRSPVKITVSLRTLQPYVARKPRREELN